MAGDLIHLCEQLQIYCCFPTIFWANFWFAAFGGRRQNTTPLLCPATAALFSEA